MTTSSRSHLRSLLLLILAALLALASAPAVLADDDDDDGGSRGPANRCIVKFVCGTPEDEIAGSLDRAVEGTYATSINIINPNETKTVNYSKRIALTTPCEDEGTEDFETKSPPSEPAILGSVDGLNAFDVDCREIFEEFGACGGALPFVEGFLILQSDGPLDVTGVYTTTGGIDVESAKCTQSSSKSDDDDN